MIDRKLVAYKLNALRIETGMTREEVSNAVGIHFNSMCSYEHGSSLPRPNAMLRIADFYGVDVQDIFFIRKEQRK
ncbi:helix-turn-helix domain-containing protein [Geomicrobium sp. JCM 19038]|uniref:helix-turn-helix domain-containing protein n=1 Tax=Geomicrobium sp. JCM 19038 TaxID=1460635 RepID=UPI00045F2CDD|nr:helix-turn-helix transcriptional regulator [Geomicrobium sp. JCM 19038]GAK08976.1 hypothetical protein JCM19038_2782 [Geomicrobium sp. JCM 19038]